MTRIQFKVYDETGKRSHVDEVTVPVSTDYATNYVINQCEQLRKIPYPALHDSGKNPVATALESLSTFNSALTKAFPNPDSDSIKTIQIIHNHHSPSGSAPEAF